MNLPNSFSANVRQNRVSKNRNVIGLYNSGRSVSLNQLNTDYVNQFYKEQYLVLKEQFEQTKRQLNKQQEQLKQLNCRLQRLLEEKKDFLSQFVHYSQVNAGYLVQELEMNNLQLEKENKKLKDQLLLAQIRAASNLKNNSNLSKVMIINMKQQLQTNYSWVKARIDSGLNDHTKRNPISGQLIRQHKNERRRQNKRHTVNRSALMNRTSTKDKFSRPMTNKERHRVSFSNQLEQEHLYEDDFEEEDEEQVIEDWSLDTSLEDEEENKKNELEKKIKESDEKVDDESSRLLDNKIEKINTNDEEGLNSENVRIQFNKAKNKIKKLEEIVFLQQKFIDRQQELANQTDHLDSLKERKNWFDKENLSNNQTNLILNSDKITEDRKFTSTNLSSNSSFSSLDSSIIELQTPIQAAGGSNDCSKSNKKDQLVPKATIYSSSKKINKNKGNLNKESTIDKLSGENMDKKTPESTKLAIFSDDEENLTLTSSSSLSSLDQLTLSVLVKHEKEEKTSVLISNNDPIESKTGLLDNSSFKNFETKNLFDNLSKQLEIEKVRNEQLEAKNRGRLRELEQNVNELSKENEILRNSLEKCIQDCLNKINGS